MNAEGAVGLLVWLVVVLVLIWAVVHIVEAIA